MRCERIIGGVLLAFALFGAERDARGDSQNNYIGAKRCQSCHPFEYRVWSTGPHAGAHASLSEEQRKDPKCNNCHTMLPNNLEERLVGVQCERCHGPGRYYHHRFVMRDKELARAVGLIDPVEAHCAQCHTEGAPSIEPFDFKTFWARIDHGRQAREAWEATQRAAPDSPGTKK